MMSVTADRSVVVRTAQTRIYLETAVATALSGIVSVRIPIYVELASAEARLSDINCTKGAQGEGVSLAVTPSIGTVALADVDIPALTNFSAPANPRPAVLVQLPATRITGYSSIALGGVQAQTVHFSPADIDGRVTKIVSTQDLAQGIAASLASRTQLQVSLLGIVINGSPLVPAVGGVLTATAPLLDGILNSVTGLLGVRLGTAQVKVHQMRCGMATLVG